MDDAFATLGLDHRLTLDDNVIETAWRELGRQLHPDGEGGDAERAAAVNQAHQVLRSSARRLRHWLELRDVEIGRQTVLDPGLMDLFSEISPALNDADEVLRKRSAASSALARALLAESEVTSQQKLQGLLGRIGKQRLAIVGRFPEIEIAAEKDHYDEARAAVGQLGFLEKWESQVQERLMKFITG
ncbi:MAG: hypothetical protein KDN19_03320 [Verrucomicrobiae bacterium]|nr:hypothetical protein [Verrucomicrobiae bacterium]